jgi:DNA polymerase-4
MIDAKQQRKIIHIDMDCFYAAVEIRDNPELRNKPVAVGGASPRSVLCTCNYDARKYGVSSAMSTSFALKKCPELVVVPVNMAKYQEVAKSIRNIFHQFTDLVEPLSLDEAYLDVTNNLDFSNSATLIAEEIRRQIYTKENLTASAGVAPNKFLAKIASGWNKPNGICVIAPNQVDDFVTNLSVDKLFGVGKVTADKLHRLNIKTCVDLHKFSLSELVSKFGKFGVALYWQSRGIDNRPVIADRKRKSLSVEHTLTDDVADKSQIELIINNLFNSFTERLSKLNDNYMVKGQFIKLKDNQFKSHTIEQSGFTGIDGFIELLNKFQLTAPIRLVGIGVRLEYDLFIGIQPDLFEE